MSHNELLAAAAHLHVLLRRKTGRITDTEWMAQNPQYASAIVQFARDKAANDGHIDLLPLAERLESLVAQLPTEKVRRAHPVEVPPPAPVAAPVGDPVWSDSLSQSAREALNARYIGQLR
ncbi:MAG: hypothetical protein RLZZ352_1551 [Pseudomonadota bacterium]|jgi:hypothetical protein